MIKPYYSRDLKLGLSLSRTKEEKHKKTENAQDAGLQYQIVLGSIIEEIENSIRNHVEPLYCQKLGHVLT